MRNFLLLLFFLFLIIFLYFFVDVHLVFFVNNNRLNKFYLIDMLTHIPDLIVALLIFYAILFLFFYKKYRNILFFKFLFFSLISVSLTSQIKDILKFIFGRYWPNTWIDNNLSLIVNNVYGFNFFQKGSTSSFPSGHAALTFSFFTMCILFFPKYKIYFIIPMLLSCLGQVLMNYHFLSDVFAGAVLGFLVSKSIYNYLSTPRI